MIKKSSTFLQRGEVATALTIAAFVFVTASALVSNVFLGKNKQTTSSFALSTPACASFFKQGLDNQGSLPVVSVGDWCILCTGNTAVSCNAQEGVGIPYQYEAGGAGSTWAIRNRAGECNETCRIVGPAPTTPPNQPTTPPNQPTQPPGSGCVSGSGKSLPNGYCSPLTSNPSAPDTRYCKNGSWPRDTAICKDGDKFCVGNGYSQGGGYSCCSGKVDASGTCTVSSGIAPTTPLAATSTPIPTPTKTSTPTPTVAKTVNPTLTLTPTPQPTAPTGQPSYTPAPTAISTPSNPPTQRQGWKCESQGSGSCVACMMGTGDSNCVYFQAGKNKCIQDCFLSPTPTASAVLPPETCSLGSVKDCQGAPAGTTVCHDGDFTGVCLLGADGSKTDCYCGQASPTPNPTQGPTPIPIVITTNKDIVLPAIILALDDPLISAFLSGSGQPFRDILLEQISLAIYSVVQQGIDDYNAKNTDKILNVDEPLLRSNIKTIVDNLPEIIEQAKANNNVAIPIIQLSNNPPTSIALRIEFRAPKPGEAAAFNLPIFLRKTETLELLDLFDIPKAIEEVKRTGTIDICSYLADPIKASCPYRPFTFGIDNLINNINSRIDAHNASDPNGYQITNRVDRALMIQQIDAIGYLLLNIKNSRGNNGPYTAILELIKGKLYQNIEITLQ